MTAMTPGTDTPITITATDTAMGTEPTVRADVVEPVSPALLRLMQLVSPALPVGAYAYSHALEWAVGDGWVTDEAGVERWIGGLLHNVWSVVDVPVLLRLRAAIQAGDGDALRRWVEVLNASRESAELQAEDRGMGQALARLLTVLGIAEAAPWAAATDCVMPLPWAMASLHWRIAPLTSAAGLLWTYVEHQVSAAVKLVPLGQTAGQRLLGSLGEQIPAAVTRGMAVPDRDIGAAAPGLAIASALHQTQYSRLFRS
jgi:urease accessory protein